MSDLRSSKQQLKDELNQMYREFTDPEEREKARVKRDRENDVNDMATDLGLDSPE